MKKTILVFVLGSIFGVTSTSKYFKKKYEKKNKEDVESVKAAFKNLEKKTKKEDKEIAEVTSEEVEAISEEETKEFQDIIEKMDYSQYSKLPSSKDIKAEEVKPMIVNGPVVISPEEFAEYDDYDVVSWTYYADHLLADENGYLVDDVEGTVGHDSLQHFGEYEDDSVFVRNNDKKCDYEILLDSRKYEEVIHEQDYEE